MQNNCMLFLKFLKQESSEDIKRQKSVKHAYRGLQNEYI